MVGKASGAAWIQSGDRPRMTAWCNGYATPFFRCFSIME